MKIKPNFCVYFSLAASPVWLAITIDVAAATAPKERAPTPEQIEDARPFVNPQTELLQLFIGPWSVLENHFDKTGRVIATVKGTEENNWILDKHVLRRVYSSSSPSRVFRARGYLTWSEIDERYYGTWFDNTSKNGPTQVSGTWHADTKTLEMIVETRTADGSTRKLRVLEQFIDESHRTATTFSVDGSKVTKLLEVQYARTIPCPSKMRMVFDGL